MPLADGLRTAHPPSILGRLTQSLLWTAIAFGLLTTLVVWLVMAHEMGELMDQELRETAEIFHGMLAAQPAESAGGPLNATAGPHFGYEEHLVWQVIDAVTFEVRQRSHKAPAQPLLAKADAKALWTADGQWRAFALPLSPQTTRYLVVAQSRNERDEARSEVVLYTLGAALSLGLLSALWMSWRIRQELSPLGALSQHVQRYDPLRPETTPRAEPRAELVPIEASVAELGQRLARRVVSERAFTAHAAHALRTPVAGIDVQLALAIKEAPEAIRPRLVRAREAAGRLGRVMQALLMMFRSGIEPKRQPIELEPFIRSLSFHDLNIQIQAQEPLFADPDLLAAALLNLLDNAQRFHARTVSVTAWSRGAETVLRLQDDGDGCTPQTKSDLQQALRQQAYAQGSAMRGLGLVLTDLVVRAHGGHTSLPDCAQGFCIELCWPDPVLGPLAPQGQRATP
jgi:two-component system OmpR family sensor kinase